MSEATFINSVITGVVVVVELEIVDGADVNVVGVETVVVEVDVVEDEVVVDIVVEVSKQLLSNKQMPPLLYPQF